MSNKLYELGNVYGRLTVVGAAPNNKHGKTQWVCLCECGTEKIIPTKHFRQGSTRSCGCLMREKAIIAGHINGKKKAKLHLEKRALGDVSWSFTKKGYVIGYWPEHILAKNNVVLEHWHEYWLAHRKADWVLNAKNMGATIHHINGIRDDNRAGNLELRWPGRHPAGWAMNDIIAILRDQGYTVIPPDDN